MSIYGLFYSVMSIGFSSAYGSTSEALPLQQLLNDHKNNIQRHIEQKTMCKGSLCDGFDSNRQKKRKRAVSAFVLFCKDYYKQHEDKNVKLCAWELSIECGKIWADMTKEEKEPYVKEHKRLSEEYYIEMGKENFVDNEFISQEKTYAKGKPPQPNIASDIEYQYFKQVQEMNEKDQALISLWKVDNDDIFNDNFVPLIPCIPDVKSKDEIRPIFVIERILEKPKIIGKYSYLSSFSSQDKVIYNEGIHSKSSEFDY